MKIIDLTYQIYKFPLSSDFTNSKQKIVNKEVIILKAKDDLNNYHFGEVSPLIGFSKETILDCINVLDTLINRKIVLGNVDEIKNKLKKNKIYPSVKFGIEQVLLSVELRYNSKIYYDKFKFSPVNINEVVGIKPPNETIKKVDELVDKNFKTIKLKIGRNNFSEDLEIIRTISEKYCDKIKIRLDVNGKWTYNEAKENFKILSQFNLQFIEQPVKELNDLEKLSAEFGQIIVPDECVETFEDAVKIIDSDKFHFIVLKPAIRIGIFDTIKIISIANSKNIKIIITSSFETIIGRSALLFLASITNHSFAHGIGAELLGTETIKANLDISVPRLLFNLNDYPRTFEFLPIMRTVQNIDHWLKQQALKNPNAIAVKNDEKQISYLELFKLANKSAVYFYDKEIKKNNHVAVISDNSLEFIVAINALWILGAIPVPINIRLSSDEKLKLIEHADCQSIITVGQIANQIEFGKKITFSVEEISNIKENIIENNYSPSAIALMMYSSGSTGTPKCVQILFSNLYESFISADTLINHATNDVWLASLPFYHIGGFSIITRSLISGCTLILSESVSVKVLAEKILNHTPTYLSLVPTMLAELINLEIKPWSKLKFVFLGGGPIYEKDFKNVLNSGWPIVTVYSSTETTSMVAASTPDNLIVNGISAGKPLNKVKIKIVNKNEKIVDKNETGEIIIESKSVTSGYYKPLQSFSQNLTDGIYRSNDLGRIDEKGNLHILGRIDDIIISGGENISLTEIENIVKQSDFAEDCATLVKEDKKWGQSYILFITTNKSINKENVKNYLSNKISKYKYPREIIILDSIPRNELGKINKVELSKITSQNSF